MEPLITLSSKFNFKNINSGRAARKTITIKLTVLFSKFYVISTIKEIRKNYHNILRTHTIDCTDKSNSSDRLETLYFVSSPGATFESVVGHVRPAVALLKA
jgi:hypothetical protein